MRTYYALLLACFMTVVSNGCDGAKVQELSDKVQALEQKVAELQKDNEHLKTQLATAAVATAKFDEIRKGYETARVKFSQNLAKLAPILGLTESPLPPFDGLRDSAWVSRLAPSDEINDLTKGLQALQGGLKNLLENPTANPEPAAPPATSPATLPRP